jgi:Bacterial regulatory proteins, crp family
MNGRGCDALGLSVPHLNRMLTRLRSEGMI